MRLKPSPGYRQPLPIFGCEQIVEIEKQFERFQIVLMREATIGGTIDQIAVRPGFFIFHHATAVFFAFVDGQFRQPRIFILPAVSLRIELPDGEISRTVEKISKKGVFLRILDEIGATKRSHGTAQIFISARVCAYSRPQHP